MNRRNMKRVIKALQSPMPEGFRWDFRRCETCAYGLMQTLGITNENSMGKFLGIAHEDEFRIFVKPVLKKDPNAGKYITPKRVAEKLQRLLDAPK